MRRGSHPSALSLLLVLFFASSSAIDAQDFRRGDVDGDGVAATMGDVAAFVAFNFTNNFMPCMDAADIDDDGVVQISDVLVLIMFAAGEMPAALPAPGHLVCGPDPTPDSIGCNTYDKCAVPLKLPPASDLLLGISSATANLGEQVSVAVTFDNLAGEPAHALSLGVCSDDSALSLLGVELGSQFAEDEPGFFQVQTGPGGWEVTLATTLVACSPCALTGVGQEILVASYQVQSVGSLPLQFCTGVADPVTPISVGVATLDIYYAVFAPTTSDGLIVSTLVTFLRGDANRDFSVDISDPVFVLEALFGGGDLPPCMDAADANDDGAVDVADAVMMLNILFAGVAPLAPGSSECGIDPTEDQLSCSSPCP